MILRREPITFPSLVMIFFLERLRANVFVITELLPYSYLKLSSLCAGIAARATAG
jgi:hypothetical protein